MFLMEGHDSYKQQPMKDKKIAKILNHNRVTTATDSSPSIKRKQP